MKVLKVFLVFFSAMPAILSTLRLGEYKKKVKENKSRESHSCRNLTSKLDNLSIEIEMKENHNPCRPLPDAKTLPEKDVMVLNDDVKVLLPPNPNITHMSMEILVPVVEEAHHTFNETTLKSVYELHRTSSALSVNAPEFTPGSKIHCGKSSKCNSSLNSPVSVAGSGKFSDSINAQHPLARPLTSMTLPCIGIDNKLRQYVWRIDKVGDLMPDLNLSVPPPRVVAHNSFHGPSIIIPVRANFKVASGGLIVNQFTAPQLPFEGKKTFNFSFCSRKLEKFSVTGSPEATAKKVFVDASVTVHPADLESSTNDDNLDASCQTGTFFEGKIRSKA